MTEVTPSNKENHPMHTQAEVMAIVEKNATLINSLEQQVKEHTEEIKLYQSFLADIECENNELAAQVNAVKEGKDVFFGELETLFREDERRMGNSITLEQKKDLLRFLEVQNDQFQKFNNRFLNTTKSKCQNCKTDFYEDENGKESCTMHPGAMRYYDCSACGVNECFNCCGHCGKCSIGCKRTFHMVVKEDNNELDF